jgi:hypothetical protein
MPYYDPRLMQQIGRMGIGMMGPPQGGPFERPKQWWEQPMPAARPGELGGGQSPQQDPSKPLAPEKPPSLLEMMMSLNRLRPPSDRADRPPADRASQASPWGWLGNMGMPGPGWTGSKG